MIDEGLLPANCIAALIITTNGRLGPNLPRGATSSGKMSPHEKMPASSSKCKLAGFEDASARMAIDRLMCKSPATEQNHGSLTVFWVPAIEP